VRVQPLMTPIRIHPLSWFLTCLVTTLTGCSVYQSADRKAFAAQVPATVSQTRTVEKNDSVEGGAESSAPVMDCEKVEDPSSLLLTGLDVIHETEAWHVVNGDEPSTFLFLWARREADGNASFCKCTLSSSSVFASQLEVLPAIAAQKAAELK
jgi:hypothetical protein